MADTRVIRIFISSPSDVRPERGIAARVVQRLAREFSYHFRVEAILWEREPMLASHQFQDLIVEPHQTDIVVVLLWSRLGMPLPDEPRWKGPLSGRRVTGTEWEFEDALAGHRQRAMPDLLVYRKRAMALPESDNREAVNEWLRQKELVDDFMGRWFRDADGISATAASRSFATGTELEEMLDLNLRELLRKRLAIVAGAEEPGTIRWHQGSPYRGLEAFGPEHEPVFFGRTRARNEVRELLARQTARGSAFVLVMGASGSGKSSLVKAGVLPQLREGGMVGHVALVRHAFTRPGAASDPIAALAVALMDEPGLPELSAAPLEYTAEGLARLLRSAPYEAAQPIRQGLSAAGRAARLTERGEARLLLVVDQLEELFTAEGITPESRERHVAALQALAASGLVWVIATMRSDFFDRLEQLPVLAALAAGEAKYLLTPPDGPEIGQIIRQPAREAGLRFEVDENTGQSLDEAIREAAATDNGSLPLLEYLLDQLWHRRTANGLLTHAAYRDLGGLEGAIGGRAEAVLASQPAEVQAALPRLLRALVTVRPGARAAATTRYAPIDQFKADGAERRLISALVHPQARLLVADGGTIRVAHEALLTHWRRAQAQIAEDRADLQLRTRLEEAAARWRTAAITDRDSLLLAPGLPLSEAEDLLERRREELAPDLIAYIEDSSVAAERQLDIARHQRDRALLQEARVVAVLARQAIAAGDAQTGMLAAVAVLPQDRDDTSRPMSPEAIMALYDGWLRNREVMTLVGHRDVVSSAAFSPDGRRAVTTSEDGTARLWDLRGERPSCVVLGGHSRGLSTAAFSPDGRRVATAAQDGTVRLWNASIEPPTAIMLAGHRSDVRSAAFSPDGHLLVTASADGTARLWDLRGDRPVAKVLDGHQDGIWSAAFSPDGCRVVTASGDGTARVWDFSAEHPTAVALEGHRKRVEAAIFSPDGRRVLTGSLDRTARLWDVGGGHPVSVALEGHLDGVRSVAFSPDGQRVATASWDGTARLWDVGGEPAVAMLLEGHKGGVLNVAFSPDGNGVVTASRDGTMRLWDVSGKRPTSIVLQGHLRGLTSAAFTLDGQRVITASDDRTARLWDARGMHPAATVLQGHSDVVLNAVFSRDGRRVLTASQDGTARLWDTASEHPAATVLAGHGGSVVSAVFSPDGRRVATASEDQTARVWEVGGDPSAATVLKDHRGIVRRVAFSLDGRRLATASSDGTARIWDVSGEHPTTIVLEGHKGLVMDVAFSPDGRRVVTAGADGTTRLWDLGGEHPAVILLEGHKGSVGSASFSPDGRFVVTASDDGTARLWDVTREPPTAVLLQGHNNIVVGAAFSPDGHRLVTASWDNTARLWDVGGRHPQVVVLEGHQLNVRGAAFSPDGRCVATVSGDTTVRVWNVSGERPISVVLEGHRGTVLSAAFSPDGRRVLTASSDGTARLWPFFADAYAFIALARRSLTRSLTPAQEDDLGLSPRPRPFVSRHEVTGPPEPVRRTAASSDDRGQPAGGDSNALRGAEGLGRVGAGRHDVGEP